MSGWEHVQDMATMTSRKSKSSKKGFEVFTEHKETLAQSLVFSLSDLATRAAGKGLIADAVKAAGNKLGQATTDNERAKFLIYSIISKLNVDNAAEIMEKFLECLEDTVPVLHTFLDKIYKEEKEKETSQPEMMILKKHQADIISILEHGSTASVAGKLLQCQVISPDEHKICVDPGAQYEDVAINKILTEISISIKLNDEKFTIFVDDVLDGMGGSAEYIAKMMKDEYNGTR
ncbi:PREDICTED: uncharacterized protein LOC109580704 [Amphimedon queenslandica]|nr:PREDICTED: uncharacterized protein LOC109580704 [Amphimedon queenslandica]|eukprot:XP_019849728.1 PREDICTED: uncharacterized protein LOC109580704 [Amphimedon queenslandica]